MSSPVRRAALLLLPCLAPAPLAAQRAVGPGEDAIVLPRGVVRFEVAPTFANWNERFGPDNRREALGARVSGAYDERLVPTLATGSAALQRLTGLADARLTLGAVRVDADARSTTIPLTIEAGVTRFLAVGVTVPFVRTRTEIVANTNDAAFTSNAGLNPARTDGAARQANTELVRRIQAAARQREAAAGLPDGGCGASTTPECALVNEARTVALDIARLYGTNDDATLGAASGLAGALAVPLAASGEQGAVVQRIESLAAAFGGGSGITGAPTGAAAPAGRTALQTLLGDPTFALDDFRQIERVHVGDVEVMAKVRLFDGIGAPGDARPRGALAVRGALAGVVRLPTGQGDSPGNALDVGTGDGQTDLELRGALDVLLGRSVWVSGVARAVMQMADEQHVRAPTELSFSPLLPASSARRARRDLGDAMELEVTPRWLPNDYFAVAVQYGYRSKKADRYEPVGEAPAAGEPDVRLLDAASGAYVHEVGFGFTWSTLAAVRRGQRTLPLDVTYLHRQVVRATGGLVPAAFTDQLRVRVWPGFGRATRPSSPARGSGAAR